MTDKETIEKLKDCFWIAADGYCYWWPPSGQGCVAAHTLRIIADELDRRNATWDAAVKKGLGNG